MFFKNVLAWTAYYLVVPSVVLSTIVNDNIPICPLKSSNEHQFPYVVYGKNPARCYVASRKGPCNEGSILFAKPKSNVGVCSCECFLGDDQHQGIVFDDTLFEQRYRYCFNRRMGAVFVYDKKRCACYQLGSQGPCPAGQVLDKDIYEQEPKCATKEDISNVPHTPIQTTCPPGTIYSELLEKCTDMTFHGLSTPIPSIPGGTETSTQRYGHCPVGTIFSTLMNRCVDMNFRGGRMPVNGGWTSATSAPPAGRCPPGTIYSTLLNKCTDMNFHGLSSTPTDRPIGGRCPPGTIYSTLLNKCTDMSFTGLPKYTTSRPSTNEGGRCPPGTIYSTLLNICTDMNFHGLKNSSTSSSATIKCPQGTIYSTLLNRCTDMSFRGLTNNSL